MSSNNFITSLDLYGGKGYFIVNTWITGVNSRTAECLSKYAIEVMYIFIFIYIHFQSVYLHMFMFNIYRI